MRNESCSIGRGRPMPVEFETPPYNNRLQRTALRAAAEPERSANNASIRLPPQAFMSI
jgi:hypothetical protein